MRTIIFQLLIVLISTIFSSTGFADSFPHCAREDAKCVGESLLSAIQSSAGGGSGSNSFCECRSTIDTMGYRNWYIYRVRIISGQERPTQISSKSWRRGSEVTAPSDCVDEMNSIPQCF